MRIRIFTLLTSLIAVVLVVVLITSIKSKIDLAKEIDRSELDVIEKLKIIRKAEKAFLSSHGYYTSNWDSLISFIENDTLYNIEKREIITPRKPEDPLYYTGEDSVRFEYDTLGGDIVRNILFPEKEYSNFNSKDIKHIPNTNEKEFYIFTSKIIKGNILVDVIEVVDKYPLDETRSDKNESRKRWFLRFGSKNEVTTTGNWE